VTSRSITSLCSSAREIRDSRMPGPMAARNAICLSAAPVRASRGAGDPRANGPASRQRAAGEPSSLGRGRAEPSCRLLERDYLPYLRHTRWLVARVMSATEGWRRRTLTPRGRASLGSSSTGTGGARRHKVRSGHVAATLAAAVAEEWTRTVVATSLGLRPFAARKRDQPRFAPLAAA
jgi:hypothetical protein